MPDLKEEIERLKKELSQVGIAYLIEQAKYELPEPPNGTEVSFDEKFYEILIDAVRPDIPEAFIPSEILTARLTYVKGSVWDFEGHDLEEYFGGL